MSIARHAGQMRKESDADEKLLGMLFRRVLEATCRLATPGRARLSAMGLRRNLTGMTERARQLTPIVKPVQFIGVTETTL